MNTTILQFQLEDDLWWKTSATLPSWKGFQIREGAYGAQSSELPSDGRIQIVFAPEGRGIEPLNDEEIGSIKWVIENEAAISESFFISLLARYPELQILCGYDEEEKSLLMPDVTTKDGFSRLIGLHSINVHPLRKNGIPYFGLEFGCTWDQEHGLGALMYGTRTVKIFGADVAILLWLAEQDAEKS